MSPTTSTVDLSDMDSKETLFVKEEETNDAEVFRKVVVDVAGSQKDSSSSVFLWTWDSSGATGLALVR